jgi:hypothetical protein
MPHHVISHLTIPAAGRLLGRGPRWAWRAAKAGKLGMIVSVANSTAAHISIADLEIRFGVFSSKAIEGACIRPTSRKRRGGSASLMIAPKWRKRFS